MIRCLLDDGLDDRGFVPSVRTKLWSDLVGHSFRPMCMTGSSRIIILSGSVVLRLCDSHARSTPPNLQRLVCRLGGWKRPRPYCKQSHASQEESLRTLFRRTVSFVQDDEALYLFTARQCTLEIDDAQSLVGGIEV